MAHQSKVRTPLEAVLQMFQPRMEEFVQARGAELVLALPGIRILVLWLRKKLGTKGFDVAMKEGFGALDITGWFLSWTRESRDRKEILRLIDELLNELGPSLADWGAKTSDVEVAAELEVALRDLPFRRFLGLFGLKGIVGGGRTGIMDLGTRTLHHELCPYAPELYVTVQGKGRKMARVPNKDARKVDFDVARRLVPPVAFHDECEGIFHEPGHGRGPSIKEFIDNIADPDDQRWFADLYPALVHTDPLKAARMRWAVGMGYLTESGVRSMHDNPGDELGIFESYIPAGGLWATAKQWWARVRSAAQPAPRTTGGDVRAWMQAAADRVDRWREETF